MKKLHIHTLQHVPFEGLGCIENWTTLNNHSVTFTKFYEPFELPHLTDFDWLIIMGGPMGVYDETIYPWLSDEKGFIKKAVANGKTVIGICLGSQLIAEVLGAKVYPNKQKEIGWFDIKLNESAQSLPLFEEFEHQFKVFHWHGDTYDLPTGSNHLFSSDVCLNEAFLFHENVLGLQFHFEVTPTSLRDMVDNDAGELLESETIQTGEQILSCPELIESNNKMMYKILDYLENKQTITKGSKT